ncbi:MAG: hypothetical protein CL477_04710 [Acidobacteria bacterium]|jgi:hypothetical protein|nr:hypothetical protein [Acidobacteriota bacterium]MDP7478728.1 hypothetical protein [Vicinamibacterales bacterium]HJN44655.1 hypothetical protein [Vicinamibacterales bacterium]|tara:strand:- start:2728 stop:5232 length:2505 start_codon:yes stop_codon:yes gene_type:complete
MTDNHTALRSRAVRAEDGVALIATLMVMLLLSSLLVGFTAMISSESLIGGMDVGGTDSFYAAHAGLEKLTSELGEIFTTDFSPSGDVVRALGDNAPSFDGVAWVEPDGSDGYRIDFDTVSGDPLIGDPVAFNRTVTSGPWAGFIGLASEYRVTTTARLIHGAESGLERVLQTVSIPVFQFGTFSETDLGFHPGPTFNFGGRVHSNGNIFLTASNRLVLSDKVTAVGEIVRARFMNGNSTSSRTGRIDIVTTPGNYRDLKINEGSVIADENSAPNEPTWTNLSTGVYNSNVRTGSTGVTRLDLPIVSQGAQPVDLVRRPTATEDPNGLIFPQRHFAIAGMRILLSDTANEITSLPTVTPTPPIELDDRVDTGGDPLNPWAGYVVGPNTPPLARSNGNVGEGYVFPLDDTSHGGFIKIEIQDGVGNWSDVTAEILALGFSHTSLAPGCAAGPNPNGNAVIRIQRLRGDGNLTQPGETGCGNASTSGYDYWPLVLYDAREGVWRDNVSTNQMSVYLSGVMHYVELDVNNLRRWLAGAIGVSGPSVLNQNGFVIYFSDRRLNKNAGGNETGELGMEDFVNPASGSATPNGALDTGEDLNDNGTLEVYGNVPLNVGAAPLDANATLRTLVNINVAQTNRPIFFRRALKLTNGGLNQIPMPGLMVTSENPMYIEGDFNASAGAGGFVEPNAATAVMSDAATFLSNAWTDAISFQWPHRQTNRNAQTTWYRLAIVSGKGKAFPRPSGTFTNFGTDGGTHNFFRMLEDWGGRTANYRGAMITFYNNRQAVGPWQCCNNTYSPPTRAYAFDVDFLDPNQLPPATPMFRDVNVMGFTHKVLPGM